MNYRYTVWLLALWYGSSHELWKLCMCYWDHNSYPYNYGDCLANEKKFFSANALFLKHIYRSWTLMDCPSPGKGSIRQCQFLFSYLWSSRYQDLLVAVADSRCPSATFRPSLLRTLGWAINMVTKYGQGNERWNRLLFLFQCHVLTIYWRLFFCFTSGKQGFLLGKITMHLFIVGTSWWRNDKKS